MLTIFKAGSRPAVVAFGRSANQPQPPVVTPPVVTPPVVTPPTQTPGTSPGHPLGLTFLLTKAR